MAYASSTNFINLNLLLSSWYFLLLNNFGFWDGTVDSWENPASSNPQESETATYELNNPNQLASDTTNTDGGNTPVLNENTVEVSAAVSATAISGQNQTLRNLYSLIKTGKSIALANLFNFLNTNIIASNFFMPIINLFGSWKGNLVFAYPNLQVEMSADKENVSYGDTLNYNVKYTNVGYEEARNVTLNINLPVEASLLSVSGPTFSANANQLQFFVGNVGSKAEESFSFSVTIQRPTSQNKGGNIFAKLFSSLIRPVEAAENGKELVTTANIATPDPETDTSKNNSSVVTYLITSENIDSNSQTGDSSPQEDTDPGLIPELEVTSSNNTGEFIYPGDIVTFFVTVKNKGLGKAKSVIAYQNILLDSMTISKNQFSLGDIEGGKNKKLTFSIQIPKYALPGVYDSLIYAEAESQSGKIFSSNDSFSQFRVKSNVLGAIIEVKTKDDGSVLAAESNVAPSGNSIINLLYLLIFALSLLWYVEYIRRRDAEEKLELILNPQKKSSMPTAYRQPAIFGHLKKLKIGIFAFRGIFHRKKIL